MREIGPLRLLRSLLLWTLAVLIFAMDRRQPWLAFRSEEST